MKKLNEDDFIKMANKIYIDPTHEVLAMLKEEYELINCSLEKLKKIDVSNVEPLSRVCPSIEYLREDIEDESMILDKKIVLDNAKESNDDFIIIKRIF